MTRLMGLRFKVVYRKSKENLAADALSRVGHLLSLQAVSEVQPIWIKEVLNSYATDPRAQSILTRLAVHSPDDEGYSLEQGLIKYHSKVWIASNSALQHKANSSSTFFCHWRPLRGHSNISSSETIISLEGDEKRC